VRYSIEKSYQALIVYLPYKVPGRRIYEIQPNGHQHWNRKEILQNNSGGYSKKNDIFMDRVLSVKAKILVLQRYISPRFFGVPVVESLIHENDFLQNHKI
jgi:hypothetical protein